MSYLTETFHGESLKKGEKGIRYLNANFHFICIIYAKMENSVKFAIFTQIGRLQWQKRKAHFSKNKHLNQIGLLCK